MNIVEGLTLVAGGLILFAYLRRRNAKAEAEKSIVPVSATTPADNTKSPQPEKRTGRARRRQFLPVVPDRRLGPPPRRRCDHPQSRMENIFAEEVDPLVEAGAESKLTRE